MKYLRVNVRYLFEVAPHKTVHLKRHYTAKDTSKDIIHKISAIVYRKRREMGSFKNKGRCRL